jgi:hypothetical protein
MTRFLIPAPCPLIGNTKNKRNNEIDQRISLDRQRLGPGERMNHETALPYLADIPENHRKWLRVRRQDSTVKSMQEWQASKKQRIYSLRA